MHPGHKSRTLFITALSCAAMLALFYRDNSISYSLLYSLLIMLALSLLSAILAPLMLVAERSLSKHVVYKNEDVTLSTGIRNRGIFPYCQVALKRDSADAVLDSVLPHTLYSAPSFRGSLTNETLRIPYRGVYNFSANRISAVDFLGLFRISWKSNVPDRLSLTVCPEADELFTMPLRNDPSDQPAQSYTREPDIEVSGLRDYRPDDEYRRIHWKLSSKRSDLIVKEFYAEERSSVVLFIDTKSNPLTGLEKAAYEDKLVSAVASAVRFLMKNQVPAELIYGSTVRDRIEIKPQHDISRVYELLAGLRFNRKELQFPALSSMGAVTGGKTEIALFMSELSADLYGAIANLARYGHYVALYFIPYVEPNSETTDLIRRIRELGVDVTVGMEAAYANTQ